MTTISNATVVDLSTDSTTVFTGRCVLHGIYVNTASSAQALPIKDDTTTKLTLVASLAAGTNIAFPGVVFGTSLIIDPDNAATGNITVFWERLSSTRPGVV